MQIKPSNKKPALQINYDASKCELLRQTANATAEDL